MLSSEANAIIWNEMLSSVMNNYDLEPVLSSGANVITWDQMLSCGKQEKVRNIPYVIIWYYHACDVILWEDNTFLFINPENFTQSLL
jgi:hypothetical protein